MKPMRALADIRRQPLAIGNAQLATDYSREFIEELAKPAVLIVWWIGT